MVSIVELLSSPGAQELVQLVERPRTLERGLEAKAIRIELCVDGEDLNAERLLIELEGIELLRRGKPLR